MKFFKVYTDIGAHKPVTLFAKLVKKVPGGYEIKYFSPMRRTLDGPSLFNYEATTYTIDDESIVERIDGVDERVIGYQKTPDGWIRLDEGDPDYEPTDTEDEDTDSETVCSDNTYDMEGDDDEGEQDTYDEDNYSGSD